MNLSAMPAVILTGGKSSRMGQPKHLIDVSGSPLWKRMVRKLQERFNTIAISCRADQVSDFKGHTCIIDQWPDIGPMGGIASALTHFENTEAVFVVSCDLPFFDVRVVDLLFEHHDRAQIACCAKLASNDFPDPLVAIWNRNALAAIMHAIDRGDYSLQRLLRAHPFQTASVEDERWLFNANTPEDLEQLH